MTSLSRLTIKHITTVLRDAVFAKRIEVPLGRSGLKEKKDSIDLSVMYSNEDHCGVCSGYANEIKMVNKKKEEVSIDEKRLNEEFIWMLGTTADAIKRKK